jgi:hypothetical protein
MWNNAAEREIAVLDLNKSDTPLNLYRVFQMIIHKRLFKKKIIGRLLADYHRAPNKLLYGYFEDKALVEVMGIEEGEHIEIRHFGPHTDTERSAALLNHLRDTYKDKKITIWSDEGSLLYYQRLGFKIVEILMGQQKSYRLLLHSAAAGT